MGSKLDLAPEGKNIEVFGYRDAEENIRTKKGGSNRRLEKTTQEELHDLYCSLDIRVIKSRRMRWTGRVARMGAMRSAYRILVGNLKVRDHFGDLEVNGRITLNWILKKLD
jgi:hypothetical protein